MADLLHAQHAPRSTCVAEPALQLRAREALHAGGTDRGKRLIHHAGADERATGRRTGTTRRGKVDEMVDGPAAIAIEMQCGGVQRRRQRGGRRIEGDLHRAAPGSLRKIRHEHACGIAIHGHDHAACVRDAIGGSKRPVIAFARDGEHRRVQSHAGRRQRLGQQRGQCTHALRGNGRARSREHDEQEFHRACVETERAIQEHAAEERSHEAIDEVPPRALALQHVQRALATQTGFGGRGMQHGGHQPLQHEAQRTKAGHAAKQCVERRKRHLERMAHMHEASTGPHLRLARQRAQIQLLQVDPLDSLGICGQVHLKTAIDAETFHCIRGHAAAHAIAGLEQLEGHARLVQRAGGDQTSQTGSDDGDGHAGFSAMDWISLPRQVPLPQAAARRARATWRSRPRQGDDSHPRRGTWGRSRRWSCRSWAPRPA